MIIMSCADSRVWFCVLSAVEPDDLFVFETCANSNKLVKYSLIELKMICLWRAHVTMLRGA